MTNNDPLLQPYQLKHLTFKNRFMISSHEPAYTDDGMPKQRYRLYHEQRAKAGVALTMTAGSALVSKDSPPAFGNILAYKDEVVPWVREMVDACHQYGTRVMIQLTHLGRRANSNHHDWLPIVSASCVREPAHRGFPKIIEDWDIERIANDYADAAERMVAGGIDGIELECYAHLIDMFWSPLYNKRDDEWGGSLDNRLRFIHLILDTIRARVGSELIVGIRMAVDDQMDGSIDRDQGIEIANRLIASGQIDFLNVVRGNLETELAHSKLIPVQGVPSALNLDFAGGVRAETKFPIFHAARIADIATARHAIATGKLDMVGMTRAHIADPFIVQKLIEGREQDIRPCVGATFCLDRIYLGKEALCVHNPASGREATMPHQIETQATQAKKIVIVGGGPAGLEAARVGAERGHQIVLFEAAPELGGQVRLSAQSQRRIEMMGIIDWRIEQCNQAGVDFRYNSYAEATEILEENPDIVIIATGGLPDIDILKTGNELVVSSWDIISGDVAPANEVLMFDDGADHTGMQAAEIIAKSGAVFEYVTPEIRISPEIGGTNLAPYMKTLQEKDTRLTICHRAIHATKQDSKIRVELNADYGDFKRERLVDQVVVNHGTIALDDIYFELKPQSINHGEVDYEALINSQKQTVVRNTEGKFQLFRIGDAVSSRDIHSAIYDALRLVKEL